MRILREIWITIPHFSGVEPTLYPTSDEVVIGGKTTSINLVDVWLPYVGIAALIAALTIIAVFSGKKWLSKTRQ